MERGTPSARQIRLTGYSVRLKYEAISGPLFAQAQGLLENLLLLRELTDHLLQVLDLALHLLHPGVVLAPAAQASHAGLHEQIPPLEVLRLCDAVLPCDLGRGDLSPQPLHDDFALTLRGPTLRRLRDLVQ